MDDIGRSLAGLAVSPKRHRAIAVTHQVVPAGLRVRVSQTKFLFPDLLVYCGAPELTDEHEDTLTNPKVIVEILSPTTADYDYGGKFNLYRRLPSFQEYILISQDRARVETFRKTSDKEWVLHTYEGMDAAIAIECLGVSLAMRDVYEGIALTEQA